MMETIFNFFLFADAQERVSLLGHILYEVDGTDEEKLAFLKVAAEQDFEKATFTKAPADLTIGAYTARCRLGTALELFEYAFESHATRTPLFGITIIMDGKPAINYISDHSPLDMDDVNQTMGEKSVMDDWLAKYTRGDTFNYADLINDDFLLAYKLLFNNKHYASAAKLLMSCIDSIAHVEYGYEKTRSERAVFSQWLDAYVDLKPIGVTADELWELRNGMLHMSNLDSNKVLKKKTRRISISIGNVPEDAQGTFDNVWYFNLHSFYLAVCEGIGKWLQTYADSYDKFLIFVERWDRTISDSRMALYDPNR
ncbi:hypothetical protein QLG06_14805 [Pseudomonas sp. V104_6]|uniref:hypothetical protein n=1 Tax=Pseudomonas sp. V104_6 TaxID=3044230 RepID=UPI00249F8F61|nr:hypothetical protein [Pseudomonas sp. V104_6]MDI3375601.1 hypothetical protein [Pseudomonas sp. V104_6]